MGKSTFFTVEVNDRIGLDKLKRIEDAINNEIRGFNATAVVSNIQYKKGAYFK